MLLSSEAFLQYKSEEIKSLGCPSSSSMLCNVCSCCKILLLILNFMHFLKYFNFPALQYFVHHTTDEKGGDLKNFVKAEVVDSFGRQSVEFGF